MSQFDRPYFVLAGGGTGGHLYPGVAVARSLRRMVPDCDIAFYTTSREIDRKILVPLGYDQHPQSVVGFSMDPRRWPRFAKNYWDSIKVARAAFRKRRPEAVLGLGGYASAPAMIAAAKLRIPTVVFNPDAVPGRANRRLIPKADLVYTQWDETLTSLKRPPNGHAVGCPVRPEFHELTREEGAALFDLDPARPTLLITGASQGAGTINDAALRLDSLWRSLPDWQIVHLTGAADYERVSAIYRDAGSNVRALDFTPKMAWLMAASDLVISRAGASTLAELAAAGVASVLLPYPFDRQKHQLANARVLESAGAAIVIEDANNAEANADALRLQLQTLMPHMETLRRMSRAALGLSRGDSADMIASGLMGLAGIEF